MGHGPPSLMGISFCHGFGNNQARQVKNSTSKNRFNQIYGAQLIRLNTAGQLGVGERCINADSQGVKLVVCRLGTVDGPWEYEEVRVLLVNAIAQLISCQCLY